MKKINLILVLAAAIGFTACKKEVAAETTEITQQEVKSDDKIVSLSGAISETIAALGHGSEIVGKDVTSTYPKDLTAKDLGHVRSMTIEPIMSVSPTLVLASEKDINPELLGKIKESGIKTELIHQEYSVEGAKNLIKNVAEILGNNDYQKLNDKIDEDIAKIQPFDKKPKVLFIYARGQMLMVAGKNTPMESLITIAGGENAVTEFEDFKPLTPESLIQGNPDVILMFESGLESAGGIDAVLKVPGVSQTNAGKNKKIISMDGGLISNFGPRTGVAALKLNKLLRKSAQ